MNDANPRWHYAEGGPDDERDPYAEGPYYRQQPYGYDQYGRPLPYAGHKDPMENKKTDPPEDLLRHIHMLKTGEVPA